MVGVFLLKEVWFAAVFLAPLIIVTVAFWLYINETYLPYSRYLTVEETIGLKGAEQRFLEEVKNRYILDQTVPEVFELSTDKQPSSEDYIPIDSINNPDTDEENPQDMKESTRLLGIWRLGLNLLVNNFWQMFESEWLVKLVLDLKDNRTDFRVINLMFITGEFSASLVCNFLVEISGC